MGCLEGLLLAVQLQLAPDDWPQPAPALGAPGQAYTPPPREVATDGVPLVFAHSDDVLPDQSFVLSGQGLADAKLFLWGPSATQPGGQAWPVRIVSRSDDVLIAAVPESAPAGLYLVWVGRGGRWGAPIRLNAPELWWHSPNPAAAAAGHQPTTGTWHCEVALIEPGRGAC